MNSRRLIITLLCFSSLSISSLVCSNAVMASNSLSPVSWQTNLHFTTHPGLDSQTVESMYDARIFLDVDYLDRWNGALGVIQQSRSLTDGRSVDNSLFFSHVGRNWHPSGLNGRVSVGLNAYYGSDLQFIAVASQVATINALAASGPQAGPGPGSGSGSGSDSGSGRGGSGPGPGPGTGNIQIAVNLNEESLWIVNPKISYLNQAKTFYLDAGFSRSEYQADQQPERDVSVTQFSPAIGFAFNQQYDWLQFRYFGIQLSTDTRTPGVKSSHALSTTWTHWLANRPKPGFESITLNLLLGERLFAVEQDVRTFYYTNDQQQGSLIAGVNGWLSKRIQCSGYIGLERYKDLSTQSDYDDVFLTFNLSIPLNR